ncbi:hypothetical protein EYF80_053677 [Liparis tanakae]|uniref:Uncharacterized protein n=1 Tax=Liparis tanakae TaxID=230148 RepID=A0A4Z2F736_9TELE|nr:hypothetical protein EYF80_053677 [Liparis tanakae]
MSCCRSLLTLTHVATACFLAAMGTVSPGLLQVERRRAWSHSWEEAEQHDSEQWEELDKQNATSTVRTLHNPTFNMAAGSKETSGAPPVFSGALSCRFRLLSLVSCGAFRSAPSGPLRGWINPRAAASHSSSSSVRLLEEHEDKETQTHIVGKHQDWGLGLEGHAASLGVLTFLCRCCTMQVALATSSHDVKESKCSRYSAPTAGLFSCYGSFSVQPESTAKGDSLRGLPGELGGPEHRHEPLEGGKQPPVLPGSQQVAAVVPQVHGGVGYQPRLLHRDPELRCTQEVGVWILFTHLTRPCRADRAVELNALREQLLDGGLEGTEHFHISKRDTVEHDSIDDEFITIRREDLPPRGETVPPEQIKERLTRLHRQTETKSRQNRQAARHTSQTSRLLAVLPSAAHSFALERRRSKERFRDDGVLGGGGQRKGEAAHPTSAREPGYE